MREGSIKMKISLLIVLLFCSGCQSYNKTGWYTPDGFNLTQYHALGTPFDSDTLAWGFSWTLKDTSSK